MPYILNNTSGAAIANVPDAIIDITTDLIFVGRNYAVYGEVQNENFLKLLENFANTSAPLKPIEGQIWYNKISGRISTYNGADWKSISNIEVSATSPVGLKTYNAGDLWYNSLEEQLYAYNGSDFNLIGPPAGADTKAQWRGSYEYNESEGSSIKKYTIKAVIGAENEVIAAVSNSTYTIQTNPSSPSFPMTPVTSKLYKGITLAGADPVTGISAISSNDGVDGTILWGTTKHALNADQAIFASSTNGITINNTTNTNAVFYVTFSTGTGISSLGADSTGLTYNPFSNTLATTTFQGTATSAYYADLAERYASDAEYEVGTVMVIGGIKEITVTSTRADTSVIGIISKNPAYMMNSGAGSDETHPYIALKGRVPCKVDGSIKRGDLLVTSKTPGYATSFVHGDHPCSVIGKALESQSAGLGVIEVLVI